MGIQISGAEWEIMQYLWRHPQENTFAAILVWFHDSGRRDWSKQTLNTYLMRLIRKGMIERKEGEKRSIYIPALTEVQYHQRCAEEILENSYGGSMVNFVMALNGGRKITHEEERRLMQLIEKQKEDK